VKKLDFERILNDLLELLNFGNDRQYMRLPCSSNQIC